MRLDSMRSAVRIIFSVFLLVLPVAKSASQDAVKSSLPFDKTASCEGPFKKASLLKEFLDESRKRQVPVKIHWPEDAPPGQLPVIIFSHGLGGSREGYAYLGRFWASHGFICVHVQHKGSDDEVWKGHVLDMKKSMKGALLDPKNSTDRPKDVSFIIDKLADMDKSGELKGRIDMDRIGVAGHSFGAYTALAVGGQSFPMGKSFKDPRVKAAIEMSAPGLAMKGDYDKSYGSIDIPFMHMTGTEDRSPIWDTPPEDRLLPYKHIKAAGQYLIVFEGGDHMLFSGRLPAKRNSTDELYQNLICRASLAFWMAYLNGDKEAKAYLDSESGFKKALGSSGSYERK